MPSYKITYEDKADNKKFFRSIVIRAISKEHAIVKFEELVGGYFIKEVKEVYL